MYLTNKSRLRKNEVRESGDIELINEGLERGYIILVRCYQKTGGEDVSVQYIASLKTNNLGEAFEVLKVLKPEQERAWNELVLPHPISEYKEQMG